MLDALLDALGYAGSSLDKLGPRPLRGLLGGKPREALSLIPFSDTAGITDPKDITTGRDLTNKWGITRPEDQGWGAWGAGVGTELALDPLAALGAGKAALKGLGGLSRVMKPSTMNPVHHLAGLLGDAPAASRAARDLSPLEAAHWLKENRKGALSAIRPADYVALAKDEGTPLGRLFGLGKSSEANVFPSGAKGGALEDVLKLHPAEFRDMTKGRGGAIATYHPGRRQIIPNVAEHPGLWSDLKLAGEDADRNFFGGTFSTNLPHGTSVHEIGHALHHGNLIQRGVAGEGDLGNLYQQLGLDPKMLDDYYRGRKSWLDAAGGLHHPALRNLGSYSVTDPYEFVAEGFGRIAGELGSGFSQTAAEALPHPGLWDLYNRKLMGPQVPLELIRKLAEYLK